MAAEANEENPSLKDQGNEFFKAGNYLKAAALYTQAIKAEPSNAALFRFISLPFPLSFYSFEWRLRRSLGHKP